VRTECATLYTSMEYPEIKVIEGKKQILFSAPHCKLHKRPKLSMSYKQAEPFTEEIVEELCMRTGGFGLVLNSDIDYDPNYQKEKRNNYKKEVREIVKSGKINYFMDIHGILDDHNCDICICYSSRYSKSYKIARLLAENIGRRELFDINVQILKFPYSEEGEALSEFVASKLAVPAIQIEIAKYIRDDEELVKSFEENLCSVINKEFV